jgi:hypothetical protein
LRTTCARGLLLALIAAVVLGASQPAGAAVGAPERSLLDQIRRYRAVTWHWQRVMAKPLTPTRYRERLVESTAFRTRLREAWRARAKRTSRRAHNPPHLRAWRCIHRYEGSWRDPNSPYYGGLQMDIAFQRAYGWRFLRTKGTANRWTQLEQMWTAERALRAGRGFYPWPVSARRCGLI